MDPTPGGNSTAYDYCSGDPINCTDLDGHISKKWKKRFGKIGRFASYASIIPGPVGAAASAVSAAAYLASGNHRKAALAGIGIAASLVGAGAAVKVGMKVATRANKTGRISKGAKASIKSSAARLSAANHRLKVSYGSYLKRLNNNKSRYVRKIEKREWRYDLKGKAHFEKSVQKRVPTPHKQFASKGKNGLRGRKGIVAPMGWSSLARVNYRLIRRK